MRLPLAARTAREFDVVGLGQNTLDHFCVVERFPSPDTKQRLQAYAVQPGGQVATALVALSRWGARTAYVGAFGDDEAGRASRAALAREGVDVEAARVRRGQPNQVSVILVDARNGERTVLWHPAVALALAEAELSEERIAGAGVLLVDGTEGDAAVAAATIARAAGVPTVADFDARFPRLERLLPLVDVLLVSWEFARAVTDAVDPENALAGLRAHGSRVVGITLGRGGAVVSVGADVRRVGGHPIAAVDTTGAGDVFHAAFIWGLLHDLELEGTLALANAAAALQCTRLGGRDALPTLEAARALAGI